MNRYAHNELLHVFNSAISLIEVVSLTADMVDPNFQPCRERSLLNFQVQYIPSRFKIYPLNQDATDWCNAFRKLYHISVPCQGRMHAIIASFKESFESNKPNKANGVKLTHAFLAKLCKDVEDY